MQNNEQFWNREYKEAKLLSLDPKPQKDFLRFISWLKKNKHLDFSDKLHVLDLGCGIGRNAYHLVSHYGWTAVGYDFSEAAIKKGKELFADEKLLLEKRDIAKVFPLDDQSIDLALDVTASNALSHHERKNYLRELSRVMKKGAYLYVRALAKEGDKNARNLIKQFPGKEPDTYEHPHLGVCERIFSGPDFKAVYQEHFEVIRMERKTGYQKFGKQSYKRNYWNVYLRKK